MRPVQEFVDGAFPNREPVAAPSTFLVPLYLRPPSWVTQRKLDHLTRLRKPNMNSRLCQDASLRIIARHDAIPWQGRRTKDYYVVFRVTVLIYKKSNMHALICMHRLFATQTYTATLSCGSHQGRQQQLQPMKRKHKSIKKPAKHTDQPPDPSDLLPLIYYLLFQSSFSPP